MDLGGAVHAQRLRATGHQEEHPDLRLLEDVRERVGEPVAGMLRHHERLIVQRLDEARLVTTRAVSARPLLPWEAMQTYGDDSMNRSEKGSRVVRSLVRVVGGGTSPIVLRSRAMLVTR